MTDPNSYNIEPRGAFGAAVPARVSGVNETLLAALLDLVQDVRDDRDRLLKELASSARENASFKVAAETYRDQRDKERQNTEETRLNLEALEADQEKLSATVAENKELRAAKSAYAKRLKAVREKLQRKTQDWNEAIRSAHEKQGIIDKLQKELHNATVGASDTRIERDAALADVDKLQAELASSGDKVANLEKELADANKKLAAQSSPEVKAAPRVVNVESADMEGVRRHLETARTNFEDDPDKCLRALNRAHSIITTSAEKEGGDRGDE